MVVVVVCGCGCACARAFVRLWAFVCVCKIGCACQLLVTLIARSQCCYRFPFEEFQCGCISHYNSVQRVKLYFCVRGSHFYKYFIIYYHYFCRR